MRRAVEGVVVGAAGGALGGAVLWPFGLEIGGAVVGGLNGVASGALGIYDWRSPRGAVSMVLDSTWGLPLVAASLFLHALNFVWKDSDYRPELSARTGHHLYAGGARARKGFVWTVGNVVSNARPHDERRLQMLSRHEGLHVWQHRMFGPLYPLFYLAWMAAGAVVGTAIWLIRRGSLRQTVDTIAYYDNPFETWAYRRDGRWPHPSADAALSWGGGRRTVD